MVGLDLGKILLEETEECISAAGALLWGRGGCHSFSFCGFSSIISRKLRREVGRDCWGSGGGWRGVGLHNSDMCIFGLSWISF